MNKMAKTAKGLDVFLRIVFWLLAAACAVTVVFSVVLLIGGERPNDLGAWVISINGVSIDGIDISGVDFTQSFTIMAAFFVAAGAIVLYGIRIILKMLRPMKEGRPFDTAVSKSFRRLGWLSLIFGAAGIIINAISKQLALSALAEAAAQYNATLSVQNRYDLGFILVAVLLFLFSYIFKYGEELQTQADETL